MNAPGEHIVSSRRDGRVIAESIEERRMVARIVLHHGREANLLAFGLADVHLHSQMICPRPLALETARRIEISISRRLRIPSGFSPAHPEPIRDGNHQKNTFRYVLRQLAHHGVRGDPRREGTNLPDLLGLRLIGGYTARNLVRYLPRVSRRSLLDWFGLAALEPAGGPMEHLPGATLAAACLPSLRGRTSESLAARTALIHVAGRGVSTRLLAELMGVGERTVRRDRKRTVDERLVKAIRLQLGLHRQLCEPTLPEEIYSTPDRG